jgi:polyadenylate-binding protein
MDRQAALSGTLNLPMQYDDLSALSPVVRKEVITGDLSRRLKDMGLVPADEVATIVESISGLSLSEVVQGIHNPEKLKEQVKSAQHAIFGKSVTPSPPTKSPSPAASQDSRLLDPNTLNATASAPEHPSTPVSVAASLSTPPRTASPSGSVPPASERERMAQAVGKLESSRQAELTELLMSLPKRDRAMCLFNAEILRQKIADAKMVLDSSDGEEDPASSATSTIPTPSTPQARKVSTMTNLSDESPKTPALSSRSPSAAASPAPVTPIATTTTYTIASLARLPAAEIVRLASSSSATGLPLPKADPLVVKSTDEFIDTLLDKPIQQQKQALGDKLWRVVKSFGIKGAVRYLFLPARVTCVDEFLSIAKAYHCVIGPR